VTYFKVPYRAWELTALACISEEEVEAGLWFLLHDTCVVGESFLERVGEIDYGMNYDIIRVAANCYHLGVYRHEFVKRQKSYFEALKDMTKEQRKALLMDYTKGLLWEAKLFAIQNGESNRGGKVTSIKDVYATAQKRNVVYFPDFDLTKFKTR